ncbi:peptide ligase PGM1-related protein [Amycolatopsis sp. NPDC058986]|uniref:preATP grasp domain-containing protein n=1 Tax=unclassified Amycolatopsis TaxID=2618356 RepID=UPI0036705EC5
MGTLLINNLGRLITGTRGASALLGHANMLDPPYDRYLRAQSHRTVWLARPGDVVIVPTPIDRQFLEYATGLRGFGPADLTVLGPGTAHTAGFAETVTRAIADRRAEKAWPYYFDRTAAALVRSLDLPVPGFTGQGGAELLNSKVMFRALAAGIGVPIAEGVVPASAAEAEEYVWAALSLGHCVIVKQDFHVGGLGNEIASPGERIRPIGARQVHHCTDRESVARFVARHWKAGHAEHEHRVVVERYTPDSRSIYVGFHLTDDGAEAYGHGEMRMTPIINGLITPSPAASSPAFAEFLGHAERLADAVRVMGYRGQLSVDGVLTPGEDVFLTEFNARSGGATHNHCIMSQLAEPHGETDRIMLDRRRCTLPPLEKLLTTLDGEGLGFDTTRRSGVVVTVHDGGTGRETGEFCAIAENLETAELLENDAVAAIRGLGGAVAEAESETKEQV